MFNMDDVQGDMPFSRYIDEVLDNISDWLSRKTGQL